MRKSLPELAEMPETAEYDVIFVGSPVWWFTLTPAVKVLSAKQNGKGSGYILSLQAAGSRERRQMILKDCWKIKALVGGSLSVPYKRNLPQRPVDEIIRWAEKNKCKE